LQLNNLFAKLITQMLLILSKELFMATATKKKVTKKVVKKSVKASAKK